MLHITKDYIEFTSVESSNFYKSLTLTVDFLILIYFKVSEILWM